MVFGTQKPLNFMLKNIKRDLCGTMMICVYVCVCKRAGVVHCDVIGSVLNLEITQTLLSFYTPFRPHRISSNMWYFPMISPKAFKISSKFGENIKIQRLT